MVYTVRTLLVFSGSCTDVCTVEPLATSVCTVGPLATSVCTVGPLLVCVQ